MFIWLGDAAYVTNQTNLIVKSTTNPTKIVEMFNKTKYHSDYIILRKTTIIEGVWVIFT